MTLHLARIQIDYETAWKVGLRDSYNWHQWAWQSFPGRPSAGRDFLTRLDDTGDGFRFLIQSAISPAKPANCPDPAWETKPIPEAFFSHENYHFSLIANPTKKVRCNAKGEKLKNSRRVPVYWDPEKGQDPGGRIDVRGALIHWLERQAERNGFRIHPQSVTTVSRPRLVFTKKSRQDEKRHAGVHAATEFVGDLTVTDRNTFRKAVVAGIGPAKAFGFGMLCLSPHKVIDNLGS